MSVYVMVGLTIQNKSAYENYVGQAMASLEKYKVEALVVCDTSVVKEGTNPYGRYVLLKFPDQAACDAWYHSPEYQAAIPLRQAAAETGFFVAVQSLG